MGLNWGGFVYPWSSAHVKASIVIGFMSLVAFGLWETLMKLKEPLVLVYVFKRIPWFAATIVSGICAAIYYAFAIFWPQMVALLYLDASNPMSGSWLSSLLRMCVVLGEIVGG